MKIRGEKVRELIEQKQVTTEQLAAALARKGLSQGRALSALNNWIKGCDHPRCKMEDASVLARELGATVPSIVRFTSVYKYHRGSPRKVKLLTDLIRGKKIDEAINNLTFTTKRAAIDVKKALLAAQADAERAEADVTSLIVVDSRVDSGPVMKRFQPKDRGRAHNILKRMSHITIGVEERN
ncbi:MAG: 50S ribosomal protein L22 [Phycisphaeraceae bacterium]|nr:50S ribosomal protein L22 [Phycisphaeraceae bacterium]